MKTSGYLQDLGKIIIGSEAYIIAGNTVLMHKRGDKKKTFPGYWVGPGGHINDDEDALTACIREVREETGISLSDANISLKSIAYHFHTDRKELYILNIFRAVIPQGIPTQAQPDEGESRYIPFEELAHMDKVFPAAKYYFDHVLNNRPGILYTNIYWNNAQIDKVVSVNRDSTP